MSADKRTLLDPNDIDRSIWQLNQDYQLDPVTLDYIRRVLLLYPQAVYLYVDEANALLHQDLALVDKFTFDLDQDELILYSSAPAIFVDAIIEMLMYLMGFSTMMGSDDEWVTEFAIGAWRPMRNRIKEELGIPVDRRPRMVIGLPPEPGQVTQGEDPYPFRTLVSHYDIASFYQMIMLAGHDEIAVSFPSQAHAKVVGVYRYARSAYQDISKDITMTDHAVFNARLLEAIQQMEERFDPATLPPPGWLHKMETDSLERTARRPPKPAADPAPQTDDRLPDDSPFASFIDGLFSDEDEEDKNWL